MNSWLNYHHLYYFKVIAHEGSISKASQVLKLGQPTLSAQLKTLEDQLGVNLFDRKHKKLILTEAGKVALNYADDIFKAGSELMEVLQDRKVPTRTHVQFGALDSIPKHLISSLVKFAHERGDCSVTLLEGSGNELLRELVAHRIDLILSNYVPSNLGNEEIRYRKIMEYPFGIYAHPKFKSLKKGFPQSLQNAPIILPTAHSRMRYQLDHYFEANGIKPDIVAETQDTALQKILGTEGLGVIPVSSVAATPLLKEGTLIELGRLQGVHEEVFLISGKRKMENPISKVIMNEFHSPKST